VAHQNLRSQKAVTKIGGVREGSCAIHKSNDGRLEKYGASLVYWMIMAGQKRGPAAMGRPAPAMIKVSFSYTNRLRVVAHQENMSPISRIPIFV